VSPGEQCSPTTQSDQASSPPNKLAADDEECYKEGEKEQRIAGDLLPAADARNRHMHQLPPSEPCVYSGGRGEAGKLEDEEHGCQITIAVHCVVQ